MQLEPAKYTSFISVDKNTISADGSGALFTGEMPTFQCFQCYIVQGWFKCGGVEICKTWFVMGMSEQNTRMNRDSITLGGPGVAEFVADVFLCPYEAYRIRYVSESQLRKWDVGHWTDNMTKFCVQQKVTKAIHQNLGTSPSEMSKDA